MKREIIGLCAAGLLLGTSGQATAEVRLFRLGGEGGQAWRDRTDLNVMVDLAATPGALQPLELDPDENVVPRLGPWVLYKQPNEHTYRDGIPRLWRADGIADPAEHNPLYFVDGDPETYYTDTFFNKMFAEYYTLDLGAPVPAERFVFYPPDGEDPFTGEPYRPNYTLKEFELTGATDVVEAETVGDPTGWGGLDTYTPLSVPLAYVQQNFDVIAEIRFAPQYLRFFRFKPYGDYFDLTGREFITRYGLAELEVYGRGFAPQAIWESEVIDLGAESNLGRVFFWVSRWRRDGEQLLSALEAPVEVSVEVKTGLDDSPIAYYGYNDMSETVEVTEAEYEDLKPRVHVYHPPEPGWRGPRREDRQDWSFWSAPLRESGGTARVPPGQYMKVRVELETGSLWEFARVDSLALELSPLLAARVVGEVATAEELQPVGGLAEVRAGEPTEFVYDLRAEFSGAGQLGFDVVRLLSVSGGELVGLEMGDPLAPVAPDSVVEGLGGLAVYLPQPVTRDGERVRLRLEMPFYGSVVELGAEVLERAGESLPQRVEAGDVSAEVGTDQLRVMVLSASMAEVLGSVVVSPRVLTPQGDGANDRVQIEYALFRVLEGEVAVAVYTLAGERVRTLRQSTEPAGRGTVAWTGRDEGGGVVAPGIYLVRVEVDTDIGRFARVQPVAVAY